MKNKHFDFMSIRFRVWLYFLGFTAIILVLMWFLQIFFLNNYYEEMKIRRTQEAANQLVQLYQADNQDGFTTIANQIAPAEKQTFYDDYFMIDNPKTRVGKDYRSLVSEIRKEMSL